MAITWPQFNGSTVVTALGTDIIVGLRGSVNFQFDANSWLLTAQNLADIADKTVGFTNLSPMTTKGDIITYNSGAGIRLGIGATNTIMSVVAGLPAWVANPGLLIANNLSDLADVSDALDNLGIGAGDDVTFDNITGTSSVSSALMTSVAFVSTGLNTNSNVNALTAHAGGGQGSALQLTKAINRVTTVATAADSVKLPAAVPGQSVTVINAAAANAMNCFPSTGNIINALSANAALSIAANKTVIFTCAVSGTWNTIVTA